MLEHESGIDPGILQERGYRTIRSRAEILDFKKYQRRAPALYIPMNSPDGITRSAQLRPDNPRRDKKGKPIKYETAGGSECILDVHPRMQEEARSGDGPIWVTEGLKKGDSLASRGECAISLIGVWNWQRDGKMLPCWDHVALEGRRVYVAFDSDAMEKEGVQLALERLVGALAERGADVLVVYLPPGRDGENSDKVGVDDYLVAGGTVNELKMLARTFEPADVGKIRLSKDEKLRAGVEDLERRFWSEEWVGMGGHTDRDVALKLIEAAMRSGKVVADGIRVVKAQGPLALEAKVNGRTLWKALNRLEERGFCRRDNKGRKYGKTGAFVLRASVSNKGTGAGREGKVTQGLQAYDHTDLHLRAPRLMWSRPKYTPKRGTVAGTRKVRQGPKPEARAGITRIGKIRGAIIDALDKGGPMDINELAAAVHKSRARDLRRRNLPLLEECGIIIVEDGRVSLTDDWLEALDEQRQLGGEIDHERSDGIVEEGAETIARRRQKNKSRAFREGLKQPTPPTPHWTNNPDADGTVEDLKPTGGDLSLEDAEVLGAIKAFEGKYGRGSFKWTRSGAKELFYSAPGGHWPDPDQLLRIRHHVEDNSGARSAA